MTSPRRPAMALDAETLLTHGAWLAKVARALVARDDEIDDVVQQTYAQALDQPPRHAQNVRGWLGAIARNVVRSNVRSRSARVAREIAVPAPAPVETPVEAVERAELRRMVVESVLALDEPYRSAVILRFFEEQEVAAIARLTAAGEDTVRTRLRRGIQRVRELLERKVDEGARGAGDGGAAARALLFLRLREIAAGSGGSGAPGSAAAARGFLRSMPSRRIAGGAAVAAILAGGAWWVSRDTDRGSLPTHSAQADPAAGAAAAGDAAPATVSADRTEQSEAETQAPPSVVPSIADSGTIRGRVTTATGVPVAGANVWALRCNSHERELNLSSFADAVEDAVREDAQGRPVDTWIPATTDDDGRYEFTGLSTLPGWQIGAFDRRQGAQVSDVQGLGRRGRETEVDLVLTPGTLFRGLVTDALDRPIGAALVRLVAKDGGEQAEYFTIAGATGADLGRYDFGFKCGDRVEMDCRAGGYLTSKLSVIEFDTPVDEVVVDFGLKRRAGTLVRGRIVDPSGSPLDLLPLLAAKFPAAEGELQPFRVSLRAIPSHTKLPPPDASGLRWAGAGEGRVDFVARMYEVVVPDDFTGTLELRIADEVVGNATLLDPDQPVDVPCDAQRIPAKGATATFAIRYVDARTKLPIDLSREATLPSGNDGLIVPTRLKDRSDAHQGLVVYWCVAGFLKMDVRISGYAPGLYFFDVPSAAPAEPRILEIPRAEAKLRGVVRHADGAPAAKVRVAIHRRDGGGIINVSGADVASNPDGEFEFASVATGEHFVVLSGSPGESLTVVPLSVTPSSPPLDVRLAAGEPTRIRVVASPAPMPERTIVSILGQDGLLLDHVESRSKDGKPSDSEFPFLLAPGRYVVHVERTGFVERDISFDVPLGDEFVVALDPIEREPK